MRQFQLFSYTVDVHKSNLLAKRARAICLEIHFCFFSAKQSYSGVYIHSSLGSAVSPFLHLVCPSGGSGPLDRSSPSRQGTLLASLQNKGLLKKNGLRKAQTLYLDVH